MRPSQTTIQDVEPAIREDSEVAFLLALTRVMRGIGANSMLYAGIDWEKLFASANPPGAPTPEVARGSYTRVALRAYHERRRKTRSGRHGFIAALAA